MESYTLPDGREPLRFDKGRAAFYLKSRGEGEVRYMFSMIKYLQHNRPRMSPEAKSELRKAQAAKLLAENPDFYREIGTAGGKKGKHENSDSRDL